MTDLLSQARNNSNSGSKKMWTAIETLALVVMKGRGNTTKEISVATGHPENSITYRFNRYCGKFESFQALVEKLGYDKPIEEIEADVDAFLNQTTED